METVKLTSAAASTTSSAAPRGPVQGFWGGGRWCRVRKSHIFGADFRSRRGGGGTAALIFDKDCRLGSGGSGYKGGHFRFKDSSDPNQPASRKPDRHKPSWDNENPWTAVGIGAIVESSKQGDKRRRDWPKKGELKPGMMVYVRFTHISLPLKAVLPSTKLRPIYIAVRLRCLRETTSGQKLRLGGDTLGADPTYLLHLPFRSHGGI